MPGSKRYARIHRLAAVLTARTSSVGEAAKALDVDLRTVRSWVRAVELPNEGDPAAHTVWTAIRDHLLARAAVMTARGETKGIVPVTTATGISRRNVAYTRDEVVLSATGLGAPHVMTSPARDP